MGCYLLQRPARPEERARAAVRGDVLNVVTVGEFETLPEAFDEWNKFKPKIAARIIEFTPDGGRREITRSSWGWR